MISLSARLHLELPLSFLSAGVSRGHPDPLGAQEAVVQNLVMRQDTLAVNEQSQKRPGQRTQWGSTGEIPHQACARAFLLPRPRANLLCWTFLTEKNMKRSLMSKVRVVRVSHRCHTGTGHV